MLACKKGGGEVKSFICEGCQKEFTRKGVLLKHQRGRYRGEETEKKMFAQLTGKNSKLDQA